MKIRSLNLGKPQQIAWNGKMVETGIFKQPVSTPILATSLGLEGDYIANLEVHGGLDKAIYGYSAEVYEDFKKIYQDLDWQDGFFGENLTIEGLDEERVWIGDTFWVGDALLEVSECRMPCFKLGAKFQNQEIIQQFIKNGRSGVYFRVLEPGKIQAGQPLNHVFRPENSLTVSELFRLRTTESHNVELLKKAVGLQALPEKLRWKFKTTLDHV